MRMATSHLSRSASSRIASSFAVCLLSAACEADNTFTTTVVRGRWWRWSVTLVVGLVVGAMAQKMLDENLEDREKKNCKNGQRNRPEHDR